MALAYQSPGVYREEVFLKPAAALPTGVPGFIGFAQAVAPDGPSTDGPMALQRKEELHAKLKIPPGSYLEDAVAGFFDNGGVRCYVAPADPGQDRETALKSAIEALAPLHDLDLVAIPDAQSLVLANGQPDREGIVRVQRQVLGHCAAHGDRLAILDALVGSATDGVLSQRNSLLVEQGEPIAGTLYYPWLKTAGGRFVPPCGHVSGVIARTDARVGVFKAPANEEVMGVLDLETAIDSRLQDQLNPAGINCLRAFPGRGIRVWGARTLSRDPNWRFLSVRRLFLTLGRWIDMNMSWVTFEPNAPRLWVRIQRELGTYLSGLWRAGALQGAAPEQAYYVKCDAENNPQEGRELGQVITEIGLAPSSPAEFIVVRVIHRAGTSELS